MPVSLQTIRRERATIEDVAASAGVSVATVSRALRGLPNVASHTRERIERIASELDYRADPAASRLAAGRSRAIAVAVPTLDGRGRPLSCLVSVTIVARVGYAQPQS